MKLQKSGGYDDGYEACPCFWGLAPSSYVCKLAKLGNLSGLRVLDAGCGEGKNAAYLAARGSNVTAIDISERAIDHARKLHEQTAITWICADIRSQVWPQDHFDIVVAYGLFHCLPSDDDIIRLHSMLSRSTKAGGYHVVCSFNNRDQNLSAHPGFHPRLMPHRFYVELYNDWTVEAAADEILYESHPHNMIPHHHSLTRLLARKKQ
jgi:tellurite methyltransferase